MLSTEDGNPIEKIRLEYLNRFCDEGKKHRNQKTKEKKKKYRENKYPQSEYILSYSKLAQFLNVGISTAYRWVKILGILKPAMVDIYNKEIVIDKKKCIELLKIEAEHNIWAKKILTKMNI